MNDYGKIILNHLFDKYERSVLSKQGSSLNIQIKVKIRKLFIKYDSSDFYNERILIDEACEMLNEQELIKLNFDQEGIIEIVLNLEPKMVKQGYHLINRKYMLDYTQKNLHDLNELKFKLEWLECFRQAMISKLNEFKSISKYLAVDNSEENKEIFLVLINMCEQTEEISFRKFSIKVLKNSKKLELIKGKIINIINDYYPHSFENEDELFSYFNIIKNPGFIYLNGDIKIKLNGQIIDIGKLNGPLSLTTANIKLLEIIEIRALNVLTIENLTSFYDTSLKNTLIIYLGGYHNTLRRELLLKIYDFNDSLKFYHFGDIDAGGFYIYYHLVKRTNIPFKLLAMDQETLVKYQDYTRPLTKNDQRRLESLKTAINLEVIEYMLKHNCKLEQEIVELDSIIS